MAKHGFIVLPPGHGKSHMHSVADGIIEADTIVPCKLTYELRELRKAAKETGDWDKYDDLWTTLINNRIKDMDCVILVPANNVGVRAKWTGLGGAELCKEVWDKNLQTRYQTYEKFDAVYRNTSYYYPNVFNSNEDLQKWLREKVREFLTGPEHK